MRISRDKIILIVIVLIAIFLRTYQFDKTPPGFNADEASMGYNAYSLIKTGADEWGERFPVAFKSYSDYRSGLYTYFTIPFVVVMGLNEWAVRLPSIIAGVISVILIYLLVKLIFKNQLAAIFAALFLA